MQYPKTLEIMKTEIEIKQFDDFNKGELYAIFRHVYLTSDFMSDDFDAKFPTPVDFETYYGNILVQPGSFLLIAMFRKLPVGYLVLEANQAKRLKHTAKLTMGLVEKFRGKGIGFYLLDAAIERAKMEKIIEIIYLMVRWDHSGAIKLYEKAGFEKLVRLEKDTKIGNEYYDGLMMRKFL
jgi:ribosomal protein S18 acetylase RimI-like enzyme